jgi:hypothetical protein
MEKSGLKVPQLCKHVTQSLSDQYVVTYPPPHVNSTTATQVAMLLLSPAACSFSTMVNMRVSQRRKHIIQCLSDLQACPQVRAGVCVCACVSQWVAVRNTPNRGEWPFKNTQNSWKEQKYGHGSRRDPKPRLCWRGPAAIDWLCWGGPTAIYPTDRSTCRQ